MRLVFLLVLILSVFTGNANDRKAEVQSIRLIRVDPLLEWPLAPDVGDFETYSLKQYFDTVDLGKEDQKKFLNHIRLSGKLDRRDAFGDSALVRARAYISYMSGRVDTVSLVHVPNWFVINGEERRFTDEDAYYWLLYSIPKSKAVPLRAHAGSELHNCLLDAATAATCASDSLFHLYYNFLTVYVFGVLADSITLQADSADIVKRRFGLFAIKEKGRQDSIMFRVYNGGRLVDSFSKFVAKIDPAPHLSVCRKRHGPCFSLNIDKVYPQHRFDNGLDSGISFEVVSFVAEIYENGKFTYSEYITGDSFTESFKNRFDRIKRIRQNRLRLRSVVIKDNKGNILISSAEFSADWL